MERVRKWAVLGRLAAIERSRRSSLSKLAFETDLAARLGLSRASLRNYADAVQLVRTVPDPELRAILFRSSAIAAAVASRWFRRDPDTLIHHLQTAFRGRPVRISDDRALLRAERESKSTPSGATSDRRAAPASIANQFEWIAHAGRWHWRPEIIQHVPALGDRLNGSQPRLIVPRDPLAGLLGLTQVLDLADPAGFGVDMGWPPAAANRPMAVAVIDIAERVVLERYRAEARNIWTRVLAASLYVQLVVLVLPDSAARRHLLSQIPIEGALWFNHPVQSTRDQPTAHPRGRSRPILAQPPQPGAAIVVVTRRSLRTDLFE